MSIISTQICTCRRGERWKKPEISMTSGANDCSLGIIALHAASHIYRAVTASVLKTPMTER